MGYEPRLAWVACNQKLALHPDTIIGTPSFLLRQMIPQSIIIPIMTFVDAT
jgi:hypothetical protein